MKKIYIQIIFIISVVFSLFGINKEINAKAQSVQAWTSPINLSNSGAASDPSSFVDQEGVIHVIWVDQFDGYKYVESADGIKWTSPVTVVYPFSPIDDSLPVFVANGNGAIHVFWKNKKNSLFYAQAQSNNLGQPGAWTSTLNLSDSVLDFDVVADSQGAVHVIYAKTASSEVNPAGIYYRKLDRAGWSLTKELYLSQYFRSLNPQDAHLRLSVTNDETGSRSVYAVWDDRLQKRIFLAKSVDEGNNWGKPIQLKGPEDFAGSEQPFNVTINAVNKDSVLLLWQAGTPGARCTQYSQWSTDGGNHFDEPIKMLDEFVSCPTTIKFISLNKELSLAVLTIQDDLALIAWDGSKWSFLQPQSELSTFLNTVTFDTVIFGCTNFSSFKGFLYVVGCDTGTNNGDIWFRSRSLGSLDEWFPPPSAWISPISITSINQKVSSLTSVTGGDNTVHVVWAQSSLLEKTDGKITIQYAGWNGKKWSTPVAAVRDLNGLPLQLSAKSDLKGRLIVTWVDGTTSEILFSWVNASQASRSSEWSIPLPLPIPSQVLSSPDILVDAAGRIIIVYAVPINEKRGIYFIESEDFGTTWSQPSLIFDAVSAGWEVVDQPKVSLSGDGRLHILFGQYSMQGDQRQSIGLYYSQSTNGGVEWSEPEMVSQQAISWSEILGYDVSIVHRLWSEKKESTVVSFHQVSHDGGMTWSAPTKISNITTDISQVTAIIDDAGGLYFLQLFDKDELSILVEKWNGSSWSMQETAKVIITKASDTHALFAASVTAKGFLVTSIFVDYPQVVSKLADNLLSTMRSVELPGNVQMSLPILASTPLPTTTLLGEATDIPTQVSPLANLTDTSSGSRSKNIVGFLLVGGVLILVLIVLRPKSTSQGIKKKKSE